MEITTVVPIIIGAILGALVFKLFHPDVKWSCMVGLHRYGYSHEKHGMHMDNGKVVGTKRRVSTCCCGAEKRAEKQDWIK